MIAQDIRVISIKQTERIEDSLFIVYIREADAKESMFGMISLTNIRSNVQEYNKKFVLTYDEAVKVLKRNKVKKSDIERKLQFCFKRAFTMTIQVKNKKIYDENDEAKLLKRLSQVQKEHITFISFK